MFRRAAEKYLNSYLIVVKYGTADTQKKKFWKHEDTIIMSYDRVQKLEQIALRSHWFTVPHIFGESMYAPLSVYEGDSKGILREQLQSTRERLGLPEDHPLIVGDLGCAYGIAVAQLNQMKGIEAFGVDQYRYPDINAALKSGNLRSLYDGLNLEELIHLCFSSEPDTRRQQYRRIVKLQRKSYPLIPLKTFGLPPEALRRKRHIVAKIQRMNQIPDNSFDFLLSSFTLIHLEGETLTHAVREIDRVLVPKGDVLLHVGEENVRSVGAYFEGLRNVKSMLWDDSIISFKYE